MSEKFCLWSLDILSRMMEILDATESSSIYQIFLSVNHYLCNLYQIAKKLKFFNKPSKIKITHLIKLVHNVRRLRFNSLMCLFALMSNASWSIQGMRIFSQVTEQVLVKNHLISNQVCNAAGFNFNKNQNNFSDKPNSFILVLQNNFLIIVV